MFWSRKSCIILWEQSKQGSCKTQLILRSCNFQICLSWCPHFVLPSREMFCPCKCETPTNVNACKITFGLSHQNVPFGFFYRENNICCSTVFLISLASREHQVLYLTLLWFLLKYSVELSKAPVEQSVCISNLFPRNCLQWRESSFL